MQAKNRLTLLKILILLVITLHPLTFHS